ncbi:MAG: M16 family metallopeptidase [Desulfurella sp.]|uniref:M16 family metallopeptidase n=1 Tax=Desulfurella sp. TaxID=1962857 RepID=UPI003C8DF802
MKFQTLKKSGVVGSVGIFVKSGSAFENDGESGLSHFVEHMVFKGTKKRSYFDIAKEIDRLGGIINAFTSKEYTCFYVKVLNDYIEKAWDVLLDIVTNPTLDENELEKEKGVIIEEINSSNDDPQSAIFDVFFEKSMPTSVGKPILGTKEQIASYTRQDLLKFMGKFYKTDNMLVSYVGEGAKLDFNDNYEFSYKNYFKSTETVFNYEFKFLPGKEIINRQLEQTNVILGCELFSIYDDRKYASLLANNFFGGNMSSKLFQSIREEKSLCYSIYSSIMFFKKGGVFYISSSTSNTKSQDLVDACIDELNKFKKNGITKSELEDIKTNFKGQYGLSLESTNSLMIKLGSDFLTYDAYQNPKDIFSKIDKVSIDDIMEVLDLINLNKMHLTCLGNINDISF